MNKKILTVVPLIIFVLSFRCTMNVHHKNNLQSDEKTVQTTGTIVHIRLEGGFFGIIADDGNKYLPLNLPKEFQKDGLKVIFEGTFRPDIAGIHMWGKYIEITKIFTKENL